MTLAALLGPLEYMFGESLRLALWLAFALALMFGWMARTHGARWPLRQAVDDWLLATSVVAVITFTQFAPYTGHGRRLDLHPFRDITNALVHGHDRPVTLANVALFVPLGVALARRRVGFARCLGIAMALSCTAEVLQYLSASGRIAQVDDVVTNTTGALLGWAIATLVASAARSRR